MVDEVKVTDADGFQKPVATDTIGGKEFQRIKQTLGEDGVAVDASVGQGPIDDGTQRVALARDDATLVLLSQLVNVLAMLTTDISGRLRVNAEVVANISTITTLTTLGNQAQIGGYNANQLVPIYTLLSEADLRANIVVS